MDDGGDAENKDSFAPAARLSVCLSAVLLPLLVVHVNVTRVRLSAIPSNEEWHSARGKVCFRHSEPRRSRRC